MTKTGDLAGPRTLEHLVDAVFYLEGDSVSNNRILRSVKNRFGPAPEVGIFEMVNQGLVDVQWFLIIMTHRSKIYIPASYHLILMVNKAVNIFLLKVLLLE